MAYTASDNDVKLKSFTPEYAQPERGKAPKVTGYRASNTIQVEVRSIDNLGKVIDAEKRNRSQPPRAAR